MPPSSHLHLGQFLNLCSGNSRKSVFCYKVNENYYFSGFGGFGRKRRSEGKKKPLVHHKKGKNILRKGDLFVVSNEECRKVYPGNLLTNNMFCAHSHDGVDTCQGDSGTVKVYPVGHF